MENNGKFPYYQIDFSSKTSKEIVQILDKTQNAKVILAFKRIIIRLRHDPLGFGELVKEYKHLKILEHVAIVLPLVVHFGINLEARVVIIKTFYFLSPGGTA